MFFRETGAWASEGYEVHVLECQPCDQVVLVSIIGCRCQPWDFSLAHSFGTSTGVVLRSRINTYRDKYRL